MGVPNIDMNLIPKDFLENKRDYQEQKSPYDLIKGDESSLSTLSNNRYVDSGMFGTYATYVDDTNLGCIVTINIDDMDTTYTKDRVIVRTIVLPSKKPNQILADEYLSGEISQEQLDDIVLATPAPQISSISTGTSY